MSELELTLGEVGNALADAEQSVTYADLTDDWAQRTGKRTAHAEALHLAGSQADALVLFGEAEKIQAENHQDYPLLYSMCGFRYCDLLLPEPEHTAWQLILERDDSSLTNHGVCANTGCESPHLKVLRTVSQRAALTLKWEEGMRGAPILDLALHHLTLGCASLYAAILDNSALSIPRAELDQAVGGLRNAGQQQYLPLGLLTRAWLRTLEGNRTGSDSAKTDLDEAWEIAERGPMPLFMADIHLYRARLFFRETPYPWSNADGTPRSAKDDLADARRLIVKHGYLRRMEELEDAERAIGK